MNMHVPPKSVGRRPCGLHVATLLAMAALPACGGGGDSAQPAGSSGTASTDGNRAPVAADLTLTTDEDTPLSFRLPAATDPDGDAVTYTITQGPRHGLLRSTTDGYRYEPGRNFAGTDTLTYRVADTRGGSNTYIVRVTVISVDNDAPWLAAAPLAISLGEGVVDPSLPAADGAYASRLALQSDGKILVAGLCDVCPVVKRFRADGTLDTEFGNGTGQVNINRLDWRLQNLYGVAVAADGRIVLSGSAVGGGPDIGNWNFSVVRLNRMGDPDTSFGGGSGYTTTQLSTSWDEASDPLILPDGRILVAGIRNIYGSRNEFVVDYPLVRYSAEGFLDTSFGNGTGVVSRASPARPASMEDGRVLMKHCANGSHRLQRLNADGSFDTAFGSGNGTVAVPGDCHASSIHLLSGGAFELVDAPWYFAGVRVLARYTADGTLVPGAATAGLTGSAIPGHASVSDIAVQPDGRAIVLWTSPSMIMARLRPDGTRDLGFGPPRPLRAGQPFSFTVPTGTFVDPDNDALSHTATLSDDSPLPGWLNFDAATLTFSGTPPAAAPDLYIKLTATDPGGLSISEVFGRRVLEAAP
jgi:uncharacterized delta-60 repeat protein